MKSVMTEAEKRILAELAAENARLAKLVVESAAENARLTKLVAELAAEVAALRARLGVDSSNSSKPPSSDAPWAKRRPPRTPSGKRPGGQPGHKPQQRVMLEATDAFDCPAAHCKHCGVDLPEDSVVAGRDHVHQVIDVRWVVEVVDYHMPLHKCDGCGKHTRAWLPAGVPRSSFGPQLHALGAMLQGEFHFSRQETARFFSDILGAHVSVGAVQSMCDRTAIALRPACDDILQQLIEASTKHADETGWRHGGKRAWLWVLASQTCAYFHIDPERSREAFGRLCPELKGVLHTDRYSAYWHVLDEWHQLCHAHLRRDDQSLIDLGGAVGEIGKALLAESNAMFSLWHRFVASEIDRAELRTEMLPIQERVRVLAQRAQGHEHKKARALGKSMLKHWPSLWRFVEVEGVEPTNNTAERDLRPSVIQKRKNGGTRSELGACFQARMQTVVATARKQGISLAAWLPGVFDAWWDVVRLPLLVPEPSG